MKEIITGDCCNIVQCNMKVKRLLRCSTRISFRSQPIKF